MHRFLWISWRWWRRAAQLALLLAFIWLFRRTEYAGADVLAGGESLFFRLDPLVGATAMVGARQFIVLFWPALIIVALTMVFGRFFCGWVCPLGTLLDYFHRIVIAGPLSLWERVRVRAKETRNEERGARNCRSEIQHSAFGIQHLPPAALTPSPSPKGRGEFVRYVLLIAVLLAAVFAFPLVGFVDPFSLLVRGLTFWGDPMLYRSADAAFGWFSNGWAVDVLQPYVKKHLLPFRANVYYLAEVSGAILAVIFALELAARRCWCRYICPLGALFGFVGSRSLLKRVPAGACKSCGDCATKCRMNAFAPTATLVPPSCTLCMDCVDFCPKGIVKFGFKKSPKSQPRPVDLSRRGVLTGLAAGAAIPGVAVAARLGVTPPVDPNLVRPPGAPDEKTFLNLCIRCGECMKVCPTNVLQPTIFEAGLEGVFSPRLAPRYVFEQSYCEYSCTLCGQVCPTGAIPQLTEELKHSQPTGKAYFDHNRCLPWAENTPCIRCEEMCPTPEKAIKILKTFTVKGKDGEDIEIQQPYIDRDLCVGCGICESNCTIEGVAGIRLFRADAPDPKTEFLSKRP